MSTARDPAFGAAAAPPAARGRDRLGLVALGGSAGGLDAVREILTHLPARLAAAVVVVQHRARTSESLAEVLRVGSTLPLTEVEDKDPIEEGHVYLAPADYHLLVEPGHFALSTDEPVLYSRPSIDVLFESVAESFGPEALAVVLTGANQDGARGLRQIVQRGGAALVQSPESAESPTMPRAALEAVPGARVLPLDELAGAIAEWARLRSAGRTALPHALTRGSVVAGGSAVAGSGPTETGALEGVT